MLSTWSQQMMVAYRHKVYFSCIGIISNQFSIPFCYCQLSFTQLGLNICLTNLHLITCSIKQGQKQNILDLKYLWCSTIVQHPLTMNSLIMTHKRPLNTTKSYALNLKKFDLSDNLFPIQSGFLTDLGSWQCIPGHTPSC